MANMERQPREMSRFGFGLRGDEPFAALPVGVVLGIREAYARGLVSGKEVEERYPGWDRKISLDEANIAERHIVDLFGAVCLEGVSDWSERVSVGVAP